MAQHFGDPGLSDVEHAEQVALWRDLVSSSTTVPLAQLRGKTQPRRKEKLEGKLKESGLVNRGLWIKRATFPLPSIVKNIGK